MEAHELAKRLLELPNETVFVETKNGRLYHIKKVELCGCEAEIIITPDYEFYDKFNYYPNYGREIKEDKPC